MDRAQKIYAVGKAKVVGLALSYMPIPPKMFGVFGLKLDIFVNSKHYLYTLQRSLRLRGEILQASNLRAMHETKVGGILLLPAAASPGHGATGAQNPAE